MPPQADKIVNAKEIEDATKPPAQTVSTRTVDLHGAKLKLDLPDDFKLAAPDPKKDPEAIATFSRKDGVWGVISRGIHGLAPEEPLEGYMNKRAWRNTPSNCPPISM